MPYIIDGHNLIPKVPGLHLDDLDDEKTLIVMLQEFCQNNRKDIEVYFDHAAPGGVRAHIHGRVTAHYVSEHESADEAIARRLQRLGKEARNWTVVTSDNQVQASARKARARLISSVEFAQLFFTQPRKAEQDGDPLSKKEVSDWLRLFQEKDE
jgi:predicted RNA-binding protein with PIN domain